jgi:hypothetical protein
VLCMAAAGGEQEEKGGETCPTDSAGMSFHSEQGSRSRPLQAIADANCHFQYQNHQEAAPACIGAATSAALT